MAKSTRQLVVGAAVVLLLFFSLPFFLRQGSVTSAPYLVQEVTVATSSVPPPVQAVPRISSGIIENAYRNHANSLPVMETGAVSRILSDDNEGSRHQRFIVSLPSGHTVLIAHNIDIAPRISSLSQGDEITFSGQYEWNDKGGVVHWTHHDPSGRHIGGYLQHKGVTYQ